MMAKIWGEFHATLTDDGVRAWLGNNSDLLYLWPLGFRVRFNPTELIGPEGQVLATEGDLLSFAGGSRRSSRQKALNLRAHDEIWLQVEPGHPQRDPAPIGDGD
jgi:hypothetical protein